MQTNSKGSLFWYVWHACRMEQRDILSVVLSLASPRPLDYSWLFTACSAVSAVWRGASFVKNYICLSCTFFLCTSSFHVALRGLAPRLVSSCHRLFTVLLTVMRVAQLLLGKVSQVTRWQRFNRVARTCIAALLYSNIYSSAHLHTL